jgi:hypothetical protein
VAQIAFFAVLTWICVAIAVQMMGETLFAKRVPRSSEQCKEELAALRARLADASMGPAQSTELASVDLFRAALGGPRGREFDNRVLELLDGCPKPEAEAAYAIARLRAAHEAMIRIDALEVAPARDAYARAFGGFSPAAPAAPPASTAAGSTSKSNPP